MDRSRTSADVRLLRGPRRLGQDDAGAAPRASGSRREGVDVVSTREPGGTALGEQIRDLVLHGDHVAPWAEAPLYAAARAQHVDQVIRPALERGATVVCDRYVDSSVAYQGVGRGLGLDRVLELNLAAVGGLLPDRTFLLELDPGDVPARVGGEHDRIEREGDDFQARAAAGLPRARASASRSASSSSTATLPAEELAEEIRGAPSLPFLSSPRRSACSRRRSPKAPAHAYLFHGPPGVGKRRPRSRFAGALLGDARRVDARTHPDLYVIEALGEMIRIDDVRALHHDLHMRPFEGDRRVYLVLDAHRMNDDAADALLKDLEEPPSVRGDRARRGRARPAPADDPLALPARPVPPALASGRCASGSPRGRPSAARTRSRAPRARRGRPARPRAPAPRRRRPPTRREALLAAARAVYLDAGLRARRRRRRASSASAASAGEEAREREQALVDRLDLPAREAEQRVRRAAARRRARRAARRRSRSSRRGTATSSSSRRGRGRRRARRPARRAARGRRRASAADGAERGSRGRARDLARARGVQPQRRRSRSRRSSCGSHREVRAASSMVVGLVGCGNWGRHILRDLVSLGCEVPVVARSPESVRALRRAARRSSSPTSSRCRDSTGRRRRPRRAACRGAGRAARARRPRLLREAADRRPRGRGATWPPVPPTVCS